jgi:hypothetical protein
VIAWFFAGPARAWFVRGALLILGTLLLAPSTAWGQERVVLMPGDIARMRQAAISAPFLRRAEPATGVFDLIALRVEFQPDDNRFTTGTGTFDGPLFGSIEARVDPLPHDAAFFDARLRFLRHYLDQASGGALELRTHLVPEVIRVGGQMKDYSPTGLESSSDAELAKLARLIEEAWALAATRSSFDVSGFDPERTAFVLFHAGVGRDVELTGTTLERTPQDLPSIFFSEEPLRRLLEGRAVTFRGLPVTHSMVIPRTHSRKGFDYFRQEDFVFDLSTNGLLAASFLNYLGVPDLFDAETGSSAIGPFGVMDPLGIFAYRGLIPPLPSAWTRYFLGWEEPLDVRDAETEVVLSAVGTGSPSMARFFISEEEYFLVENRNRDPRRTGLEVQVYRDGIVETVRFEHGQEGFNNVVIDDFPGGVLVGASHYDWALPGGVDEHGGVLEGGVLVWHVDERRLQRRFQANRVNTGPEKAIVLREADSAQDIGRPNPGGLGPRPDLGSPFDFFYEGNPVRAINRFGDETALYRNRFGPDTYPSSRANNGGQSFIVLEDFSRPGPTMSVHYRIDRSGLLTPLDRFTAQVTVDRFDAELAIGETTLWVFDGRAGGVLEGFDRETGETTHRYERVLSRPGIAGGATSFMQLEGETLYFVTLQGGVVERIPRGAVPLRVSDLISKSGLVVTGSGGYILLHGNGSSVVVSSRGATRVDSGTDFVHSIVLLPDGVIGLVTATRVMDLAGETLHAFDREVRPSGAAVAGSDRHGTTIAVPLEGGQVLLSGPVRSRIIQVDGTGERLHVAGGDVRGDGLVDFVVARGHVVTAYSAAGAVVAGFPRVLPNEVVASPLVLSNGTDRLIILRTSDGSIHAVSTSGSVVPHPAFPLATGRGAGTPLVADGVIYVIGSGGRLAAFSGEILRGGGWTQVGGDGANTSAIAIISSGPPIHERLILSSETYNWPNPIRDGETFLRVATSRQATVSIAIVDLAGSLIDRVELGPVSPETPTEVAWSTTAGSGVYLARVTAVDASGETETRIIRMAVVR